MSFTGLVPGEDSTGLTQRRGSITRAGNAHLRGQLCEAAWAYQHSPNVGAGIRERQKGVPPETVARSWAAQVRLSTPVPSTRRPQERALGGGRRHRPRARRVPLGRDDRRELSTMISSSISARSAPVWSSPPRRAGAPPQQIRSSPALCPASLFARCHGRPDSEATTCEWLYCDFDTRTSSWRFSDPLRSGASSMAYPAATFVTTGSRVAASTPTSTPFVLTLRAPGAAC